MSFFLFIFSKVLGFCVFTTEKASITMSKNIDFNNENFGFEDVEISGTRPASPNQAQEKEQRSKDKVKRAEKDGAAIAFSSKVVHALKSKLKEHNKKNPTRKVSLSQLKKVYRRGAGAFSKLQHLGQTRGSWALARVNMFLKMKKGGKVKDSYRKADEDVTATTYELEFTSYSSESVSSEFDVTENIFPDDEDFLQASKDIEEYDLDYDFQNVDELYLDDYKPVGFMWKD